MVCDKLREKFTYDAPHILAILNRVFDARNNVPMKFMGDLP